MDVQLEQTPAPPRWSNILRQTNPPPPEPSSQIEQKAGFLVGSCKSSEGISVAVVDANAIIQGGDRLPYSADRFVSVAEVINEIRDPASRHSLNFLPFTVDTLDPSPDALEKVIAFARATGDLQTLSAVDLKLIALTYTLEERFHGTQHLRNNPPPIRTVNVKRLPEKDMPGWGSNVPNLDEWEVLEHVLENGSCSNSRILPLKDLSLNVGMVESTDDGSVQDVSKTHSENHDDFEGGLSKPGRYLPKKREVKIEGKKMVADGIDSSQGETDGNAGDWRPAVSRSTHRRYIRRKAKRELNEPLCENGDQQDADDNIKSENIDDVRCPELVVDESYEEMASGNENGSNSNMKSRDEDISTILEKMRLEKASWESPQDVDMQNNEVFKSSEAKVRHATDNPYGASERVDVDSIHKEFGNVEITSQASEDADPSHMDDSSEQSWTLRSLSESSVACVTSDFAMQNVLLQMGLRLLAPGGMQIHELHRWVLKCHACFKVTTEIGRIFCPNCGNGGTLRKVAVTVGENGIVLAGSRPRTSLRGTKFSLPLPQGGRHAITKNPILREDQLPKKFLYPKTKKKNKEEGDMFLLDDIFRHHNDKKSPLQPPVRKAMAVFSGKRNPNDNHFARATC